MMASTCSTPAPGRCQDPAARRLRGPCPDKGARPAAGEIHTGRREKWTDLEDRAGDDGARRPANHLPVDVIKLDKSIVDTYLVPGKDHFIQNVIRLVHDLDKRIIIEGVETQGQARRLKELGADIIQGYYYSKPIPPENAIDFILL